MTYYSPIGYLITNVSVTSADRELHLRLRWVLRHHQPVRGLAGLPLGRLHRLPLAEEQGAARSRPSRTRRDFRLARLALVWFLVVFLAYVALYFYGRVTYPYYFIPAVPALAIGAAYFLTRSWFPRPVAYIFLAGVFLWFFIFYPDKASSPTQVRVWLGH